MNSCFEGLEGSHSVNRHVVSRYFEDLANNPVPRGRNIDPSWSERDPYFSEEVRSEFRAIGRADSTAPSGGRARGQRPAPQQY